MTDEEIVKALEYQKQHLLNEEKLTGNTPDTQVVYMRGEGVFEILDLIHRLQEDYSKLKERYIKVLDLNEKVIAEQKAEIERLKDEFKTDYRNSWKNKFFSSLEENAELQKQVDELKSENAELYKEHTTLMAGSILEKQNTVKDTAKEILEELDLFFKGTTFRKGYEFKKIDEKLKEIAKRKGVEVK